MKIYKITIIFFIFFSFLGIAKHTTAQCKDYAITICKPELYPYIHDGIYNSQIVKSGEYIELYKTFFKSQNYRLLICKPSNLPDLELIVMDTKRNKLYSSLITEQSYIWDFKLQSSQQLIVSLNINKTEKSESGCVSLLIGLEDNP